MAAPRALFDLQCHVNRASGRPPVRHRDYQPEPLLKSIQDLAAEGRQIRRLTAGSVLSSRLSLSEAEYSALFENLLPGGRRVSQLSAPIQSEFGTPAPEIVSLKYLVTRSANTEPSWLSDEQSEVSQNGLCTTASAWLRTNAPLDQIAPRIDPQNWDNAESFIEEAFGISPLTDCTTPHTVADEVPLGNEYKNQRLHEQVSASLGPLSEGLACDLNVSFGKDFGSPVPNHALYELICDHKGWIDRNEGHCYVKEESPGVRLLFASKHLCFKETAPPLLPVVAPLVLPVWLRLILSTAIP